MRTEGDKAVSTRLFEEVIEGLNGGGAGNVINTQTSGDKQHLLRQYILPLHKNKDKYFQEQPTPLRREEEESTSQISIDLQLLTPPPANPEKTEFLTPISCTDEII